MRERERDRVRSSFRGAAGAWAPGGGLVSNPGPHPLPRFLQSGMTTVGEKNKTILIRPRASHSEYQALGVGAAFVAKMVGAQGLGGWRRAWTAHVLLGHTCRAGTQLSLQAPAARTPLNYCHCQPGRPVVSSRYCSSNIQVICPRPRRQ